MDNHFRTEGVLYNALYYFFGRTNIGYFKMDGKNLLGELPNLILTLDHLDGNLLYSPFQR